MFKTVNFNKELNNINSERPDGSSINRKERFAVMNLEELMMMYADVISRTLPRASGFLRAHGLVGELQGLLLKSFGHAGSITKMASSLVDTIAKIRDSAKLANLTIVHIKDLVAQRMISDTSRWDAYIKAVKTANADLIHSDPDLTMRLILEKPIPIDKWHLEMASPAFSAIESLVKTYTTANPNIPPVNELLSEGYHLKESKASSSAEILQQLSEGTEKKAEALKAIINSSFGLSDAGYLILILISANLTLNPEQFYSFIPQSSQIVTTGALHNHADVMDKLSTLCHALLEVPSMFVLEAVRLRKQKLEIFYGSLPEISTVKDAELIIDKFIPVDVFNVKNLASKLLNPISQDSISVLIKELLPENLLSLLLTFNEKLRNNRRIIERYEIDTLEINDLFQIPKNIRAALYSTESVTFEKPFRYSDLKVSLNDYADALMRHANSVRLQERCFHIGMAKELASIINTDKLIPGCEFFFQYELDKWPSSIVSETSDSLTYGSLNPTSFTISVVDRRMSFSMGLASSIFSKIDAVPSALAHDEVRLQPFKELLIDYQANTIYYPAMLWRGQGVIPVEIFLSDIRTQFAQLVGLSARNFVELLLTGDLGIPTLFSSFGVFSINDSVVTGYGRPYGLSYQTMKDVSTISDTLDRDANINFHYFNASIELLPEIERINLSVGRLTRFFSCKPITSTELKRLYEPLLSKDKDAKSKSRMMLTMASPLRQFALVPHRNHIVKPSVLVSPNRFEGNEYLAIKTDSAPSSSKTGGIFMSTKKFKGSYGSDAWFLDKTFIEPIMNIQPTADQSDSQLEKLVNDVLSSNVQEAKSTIPLKPDDKIINEINENAATMLTSSVSIE